MNKIIPFNKDITFNESIGDITSIALDDTLKFMDNYTIKGELIVRGCHKYLEIESDFSYPIPVEIAVDSKYDTSKANISVDDFYYEIINDNILRVKIDLILDDLEYKEEEVLPDNLRLDFDLDIKKVDDLLDASVDLAKDGKEGFDASADLIKKGDDSFNSNVNITKKGEEPVTIKALINKEGNQKLDAGLSIDKNEKDNVMDLFKETAEEPEYSIYRVYKVLENDTIDSILKKYGVSKEDLENYNDLNNVKPGDKLIIPSIDE